MEKSLNLVEKMPVQKKKYIKNFVVIGGALAIIGGGFILRKYDQNLDHTKEVCIFTKILGPEHQIEKIMEESNNQLIGLNNSEIVYGSHVEQKLVTKKVPHKYETYYSVGKRVPHIIDGKEVYIMECVQIPTINTEYIDEQVYEDVLVEDKVVARKDEIVICDPNNDYKVYKTLKL